jgi:hypothetical protein
MDEMGIEQYLLMNHTAYKETMLSNMSKNKRNAIDITLYCHNKYPDQTIEQIVEDIKKLMEEDNGLCN